MCSTAINGGDEKEVEADKFVSDLLLPSAALFDFLKDTTQVSLE